MRCSNAWLLVENVYVFENNILPAHRNKHLGAAQLSWSHCARSRQFRLVLLLVRILWDSLVRKGTGVRTLSWSSRRQFPGGGWRTDGWSWTGARGWLCKVSDPRRRATHAAIQDRSIAHSRGQMIWRLCVLSTWFMNSQTWHSVRPASILFVCS